MLRKDRASQESPKFGPASPTANNKHLREKMTKKQANFDEVYVTVPTALYPPKHTAVTSLSSVLKVKRAV